MAPRRLMAGLLAGALTVAVAHAVVTFGLNPFGTVDGTGAVVGNGNPGAWTDGNIYSSSFVGPLPAPAMYREERWAAPQTVGAIILDSIDRDAGGTITAATTPGGPFSAAFGSFSQPDRTFGLYANPGVAPIHGVRVEVNSTTTTYYQMGETEFLVTNPGPNLALGATTINSPGGAYGSGSVTDQYYYSEWRANEFAAENWVGFDFGPGVTRNLGALRVVMSTPHGGVTWVWPDFDLQISTDAVNWTTLGRASGAGNYYWIDLGGSYEVRALRLYGSTAGGNNPTANNGKIVDEILAFAPIPEPAGLGLLLAGALGWLAARRRR